MRTSHKYIFALIVLSYVFLILGNSLLPLTYPDEVFYSGTAKEMMQQKTWGTPILFGQPQFEKPILTYWLLRISYAIFGVTNFGARFPAALFALLGVLAVYWLALVAYKNEKKAFLCAFILSSAGFYIGMARTVFTDMIFSVLILFSFASFFIGYTKPERKTAGILLFFVFAALAVLAKGPLGFIIPLAAVFLFLLIRKELKFFLSVYFLWGFLLMLLIALPWYAIMIKKYGKVFIDEFFYNDHWRRLLEAEHPENDNWYFYPFTIFACMAPWSIYVYMSFVYLFKRLRDKNTLPIYLFLSCWFLVTFVVFQVAHSKLTSYILPLFPVLAVLTGDFLFEAVVTHKKKYMRVLAYIFMGALSLLPVALVINSFRYQEYIPSRIPVYVFITIFIPLLGLMFYFIRKGKLLAFIYTLALPVPLILFFVFSQHKNFDNYVSSENASAYLLSNYKIGDSAIVCSKGIVRGVRFFTDKNVAVTNIFGTDFFSPHPIPYFNRDSQLKDFLIAQGITYCVVLKSSLTDLRRVAADNKFELEELKTLGNQHILRVRAK